MIELQGYVDANYRGRPVHQEWRKPVDLTGSATLDTHHSYGMALAFMADLTGRWLIQRKERKPWQHDGT